MKNFRLWMFLVAVPLSGFAQDLKGDAPIPFDPAVKTGKLKNGLTYYIRKNAKPENKVDLRLVINAGSILEEDDQQGLAHFMEHMCFNGTKRFPKNALVDYLQSIGVKFGQHLNAYTSFDETVYFLPIPSDSPEKVEKGFQILEDWAFNAVLTPEEIDKERGVVLEEYRLGLGADDRMTKRFMPKMMYQSHYANRLPIGQKEILENFKYDKLIKFYKDWYRPDLMAVIVVGDIDVAEMEKKIKDHFGSYQNPKKEKPRKIYDVPNHKETFVSVESDKEASYAQVQLLYKDYTMPKTLVTINDFKQYIAKGLFSTMLNNRLQELTHSANPPFTFGYTYHGETWARTKEAYQSFAMTQENKQLDALKVLVEENERVKKFGFTEGELERAKTEWLAGMENAYNDRDKTESERFVSEYQGHFLTKEPTPGIEWTFNAMQKMLPQVSLADVNGLVKDYIKNDNRVVIFTGPEKDGLKKPTESEVLAVLNKGGENITAYEDVAVASSLLRKDIKAGNITKKEKNDKLGTTTLTLSNGVKVTYKKTDFKNDEVIMEGISFGGSNLYSNDDIKKVQFAQGALAEAGFSGLKLNDINKFMTGKLASARPYIGSVTEGFRGSATPKDMEYMFQMVHAYFTDLNLDKEAYEGFKQKQSAFYANMASEPSYYFQQEFYGYLYKDNPRFNGFIPTEKTWAETDYQLAYNKYKERFANAGDFEFYFVGNIDDKAIEEYSAKYLASLPSTGVKEKATDLGYRMLKGEHKKVVNKGTDPKSNVTIMYYGDATYSPKEALAMQALGEILTIKLIEELRENESGVYGVNARGSMGKVPNGSYNFNISFPCGPDNAEKLTESALRELQKIIDNGPEAKDLAKYKEGELLDYKKDIKENNYWLSYFTRAYTNGTSAEEIFKVEEKINALTAKEVQDVAKKYLTKDKVIGMLMPEQH
ncbi:insulinase family protein [Flavobacterium sp. MFBS3-15]|uniref:M16 family metallopeptidase n=1 Tax=Flavobacterium sp. MFBS3-15 TaxID=2989816 RepID=UPI0022368B6C|nr:M16 family metallopeptidase [Flavobacterium sp. MFBS3-15]MCW4469342.1 insulinase family protein [Flavobacterium sp. MFBS3-15]